MPEINPRDRVISLERGLDVLLALGQGERMTLREVAEAAGVSRAAAPTRRGAMPSSWLVCVLAAQARMARPMFDRCRAAAMATIEISATAMTSS